MIKIIKNYRCQKIITRARETCISDKVLIEYPRKNYWLIRANIYPYCNERFASFLGLLYHMKKEAKFVEEDYMKLREKFYIKRTCS